MKSFFSKGKLHPYRQVKAYFATVDSTNPTLSTISNLEISSDSHRSAEFYLQRKKQREDLYSMKRQSFREKEKQKQRESKKRSYSATKELWRGMSEEERVLERARRQRADDEVKERLLLAQQRGLKICIDLSLDEEHNQKERNSLFKQLGMAYGLNRQVSPVPARLFITSLPVASPLHQGLLQAGLEAWVATGVEVSPLPPWQLFDPGDVVMLSPDADEALTSIDPSKVYVVGGIVDSVVRKYRTAGLAQQHSLQSRRLPIQELLPQRQSHILNIDTVVNILNARHNGASWADAFNDSLPNRIKFRGKTKPATGPADTTPPSH